jgi:hypothetical protein
MIQYLVNLRAGKIALWCYLLWYLVTVFNYFDPAPLIWLNAAGISALMGVAILLSVGNAIRNAPDRVWQVLRFFLMPFCVSSFSSLIKGKGFVLIVPPTATELAVSVGVCLAFVALVFAVKSLVKPKVKLAA